MSYCKICGDSSGQAFEAAVRDYEYGTPGAWDYRRCLGCGGLTIDPIPNDALLARAYPADYHAYSRPASALQRAMKNRYWLGKARRYRRLAGAEGRVLDVGCGHGDLLEAIANRGHRRDLLAGLDFSAQAVASLQSRGITAWQGEVEGLLDQNPGTFNLISLINFIEHVRDPVAVLRACRHMLRPGGWIIGEMPNPDCWDRRLFGRHWGGYHAPRHLHLMDEGSFRQCAQAAGFGACRFDNMLQTAHWALSVQNFLVDRFHVGLESGRLPVYGVLQILTLPINVIQYVCSRTTSVEFRLSEG